MSQNRGYRRDGRQHYQMNSSQGYGRSGQQMAVNPWEGGMVPGGRGGVAGLLPTPPQASSLLSQLSSSPEAQLALASNLLSTILRPQQQSQVPSLLSLDSVGPMGGSGMGYRQGGYGGRYDDPGPNRRKRMDSRRNDPYNKPMQGRRNAPARGGADRKTGGNQGLRSPSIGKGRSGTISKSGGKGEKKDDETKKEKEDDKTNDAEKKTDEEDSKREDGEDGDEKKRDWKDEKKSEEDKGEKPKENSVSNTRYSGIAPALLYCHVCKKHMWDENSFQNHLKGRTHQLMMDKLEESYKIKVELMRHEQKVAEQQREIELERMKRQGKKVNMNIREYCTMCDLHFFGNLIVHRKNDRHQQLKNFLHPRCSPCGKEFPTRVEWDHHRLTPLHLRKTAEARSKSRKSGGEDEFGIEELISAKGGDDLSQKEIKVRTREEEEDEIKEGDKSKDGEEGEEENKDKDESTGEAAPEGEEKDGEKSDGESTTVGSLRFRVPKYNPDVAVGLSLLKKMTGQMCRACHRFFINSEDAKTHCRTMMHYNNFVALVKEKAKAAEAKEKREPKSEDQNTEETAEEGKTDKGTKRPDDTSTVDDEGNWKRRKVTNAEDEDEDADGPEEKDGDGEEKKTENEKPDDKAGSKEEPMETNAEAEAEGEGDEEKEKEPVKKEKEKEDEEEEEEEEEKEKEEKKENKSKTKKEDESGDDSIWSEVDRDIGNLLDAVDGEGETESLNEEELLNPKQDDSSGKGTPRGRNKAIRGGSVAAKATRGRKKK